MGLKLAPIGIGANETPGPGAYKPTTYTLKSFPTIGFKTDARSKPLKNDNPAPDHYDPSVKLTKEHFAEVKIGTSERPKPQNLATPAPGEYEIPGIVEENFKAGRGPSLSSRYQNLDILNESPGPGMYQPGLTQTKVRPMSVK